VCWCGLGFAVIEAHGRRTLGVNSWSMHATTGRWIFAPVAALKTLHGSSLSRTTTMNFLNHKHSSPVVRIISKVEEGTLGFGFRVLESRKVEACNPPPPLVLGATSLPPLQPPMPWWLYPVWKGCAGAPSEADRGQVQEARAVAAAEMGHPEGQQLPGQKQQPPPHQVHTTADL